MNLNTAQYLDSLDSYRRADAEELILKMSSITGEPAVSWNNGIVGFGTYHYVYESGREGDWFLTGFSVRKKNISIYLISGFELLKDQLQNLGLHSLGKSCLYIQSLDGINREVLYTMIAMSVSHVKAKNQQSP